jgi:lipoprotein-anchoring transpeptidase ErfK/SrfK
MQRMFVYVDGELYYTWPVSTARRGYRTPTGTYRVQSMKRFHRSSKYHNSPMPHSIFFHRGYAIHGSYATRRLGRRASHGCIRLHPSNARELYGLVRSYGRRNTRIIIRR